MAEPGVTPSACATGLHRNVEVLVPLTGLIDVSAEIARLEEIDKLEAGLKSVTGKLSNEKFVSNAPDAVVAKERAKQKEMQAAITALRSKLDELNNLPAENSDLCRRSSFDMLKTMLFSTGNSSAAGR